jgi:hypothetical protein
LTNEGESNLNFSTQQYKQQIKEIAYTVGEYFPAIYPTKDEY